MFTNYTDYSGSNTSQSFANILCLRHHNATTGHSLFPEADIQRKSKWLRAFAQTLLTAGLAPCDTMVKNFRYGSETGYKRTNITVRDSRLSAKQRT